MNERRLDRLIATSAAALLVQFALELLIGIYLGSHYTATSAGAHASTESLRRGSTSVLVNFHYWASTLLILQGFGHIILTLWAGQYRAPNLRRWIGSILLFLLAFLFQVTGNLLPFDRHDVQTAAIEAQIAGGVPIVGSIAKSLILGGHEFNDSTIRAWYLAHHWLLPLLALVAGILAFGGGFTSSGAKPTRWLASVPLLVAVTLAGLVHAPAGSRGSPSDYTAFSAQVSWYTWPMHGALMAFDRIHPGLGWIGTALLPLLFVVFLLALPYLARKITPTLIRAFTAGFLLLYGVMAIAFGGGFAPLTGNQDPKTYTTDAVPSVAHSAPVDLTLVAQGKIAFEKEGCATCHGAGGEKPTAGPSLKGIGKEHPDSDWYMRFIHDPKSVHPGSRMPAFSSLPEDTLRALAEYLRDKK